jgi:hypothetical protein
MTEPTTPTSPPSPSHRPEPKRERRRNWLPSLVWLIPIVAAVVGLTLVAKILVERGPIITISFVSAEGLEAGKTKVKYKDVDIGQVQSITLSKDRSHVVTTVQLTKEAESFTADDTRFWVVRPRVAASGISGLNTLLSGRLHRRRRRQVGRNQEGIRRSRTTPHHHTRYLGQAVRAACLRSRLGRHRLAGVLPSHQGRPGRCL